MTDDIYISRAPACPSAEPEAWLIWSGEHKAWWRKGPSGGYAIGIGGAGRWTRSEAEAMTRHCAPGMQIDIVPDPYGPFAEHETDH